VTILTINSGSSSLKFALFSGREEEILSGAIERIGLGNGAFHAQAGGRTIAGEHRDFPDHDSALERLFAFLDRRGGDNVAMVGHRLVYGGAAYEAPHEITPRLLEALRALVPFAPEHLPHELKAIEAVQRAGPRLRQYACFDTAFHCQMPEIAKHFPIPRDLWAEGVIRYGFHGLSYSYILEELAKEAPDTINGRIVIAHLGNGASMVAVKNGKPLDTTMGLTPAGGLMMGSRSGDLDPGVLLYLQEEKKQAAAQIRELVNRRSGLLGVSGISSDMRDLASLAAHDPKAAEAIALYCYQARKHLGALTTTLGGLDTLIFTAGIGENSPEVRAGICANLEYLGTCIDADHNRNNRPIISTARSGVVVRIMKTNEDLMIARQARRFMAEPARGTETQ
jgi:acetate kinase